MEIQYKFEENRPLEENDKSMELSEVTIDGNIHSLSSYAYIKDLEKKCRELESENRKLKGDLDSLYDYTGKNWSSIIDNTSNTIITINTSGMILYSNNDFLGYESSELIGKSYYSFLFDKSDEISSKIGESFYSGSKHFYESRYSDRDGSIRNFENFITPILYKNEIMAIMLTLNDITEKSEINRELESYRQSLEFLEKERLAGKERIAEFEKINNSLEIELSEKKRTEKVLQEQKFFLQEILDRIPLPIYYIDKVGIYLGCNSEFEKLLGASRENIIGRSVLDFFEKDIAVKHHNDDMRIINDSSPHVSEFDFSSEDNVKKRLIINKAPYRDINGELSGLIGIIIDVTEEQKSKNLIKVERDFNKYLSQCYTMQDAFENLLLHALKIESIDCGIVYFVDSKSENLYLASHQGFSQNFLKDCTIVESTSPIGLLSKKKTESHFSHNDITLKKLNNYINDGVKSFIVIPVTYKNEIMASLVLASRSCNSMVVDNINTIKSMTTSLGQAVYKIQMDIALKDSELRYKRITESITDFIYTVEMENNLEIKKILTAACEAVTGYTPYEFEIKPSLWSEIVHEDDRENLREYFSKVNRGKEGVDNIEYRIIRKDQEIRWVRSTIVPHYNIDGTLISYDGLIQDITEYKMAFLSLLESERVSNAIINTIDDALYMINRDGFIIAVNDAGCKKFNSDKNKVISSSIYSYCHGENLKIKTYQIKNVIENKKNIWFEDIENGEVYKNHFYPVMDNYGEVTRIVILSSNITKEKKLENEVVNISEKERIRIGHDLHDGVGQYFAGIGFITSSLKSLIPEGEESLHSRVGEIVNLVSEAKKHVRIIAKGYAPVDLNKSGLLVAVKELCRFTENHLQIPCSLKCDFELQFKDNTISTHIFYIIREAVNNAIHHGKSRSIIIEFTRYKKDMVIKIEDDGYGFNCHDSDEGESTGLGLRLMRYRASIIGATLNIFNNKKKGATVSIEMAFS